eukprot:6567321-Karenia_brevis.AAC.1
MEESTHGVAIVIEEAMMTMRCSDGDDATHGKNCPPTLRTKRRGASSVASWAQSCAMYCIPRLPS